MFADITIYAKLPSQVKTRPRLAQETHWTITRTSQMYIFVFPKHFYFRLVVSQFFTEVVILCSSSVMLSDSLCHVTERERMSHEQVALIPRLLMVFQALHWSTIHPRSTIYRGRPSATSIDLLPRCWSNTAISRAALSLIKSSSWWSFISLSVLCDRWIGWW